MITVSEAAKLAGRDPETIRRWIRAGKLTSWKVGTQHVIDEDDLANVLAGYGESPSGRDRLPVDASPSDIVGAIHRSRAKTEARSARPRVGDPWLPAIVGRIVRAVDPVRIILFGSRARGDAREDSDYDLLVVFDAIDDRPATRMRIRSAVNDLPIAKDVVVATTEEESWAPRLWGDTIQSALAEGRVVYERA
jgi:uncharacterized protein